ncbi:MAG: DinB family protein [Bacteroidota bacterium]|nr:DinB family protein [Bacteroidota bacterium]
MFINSLKKIFNRDLEKLKMEICLYQNEKNIWITDKKISNSAGNLCLHLIGNLNTYIGAEIGKTSYVRNRDLEFSLKDTSKARLIDKIDKTILVVESSLNNISEPQLQEEYPLNVLGEKTNYQFFLLHLATHLNYHLGQVNYHRRLLDVN